MKMLTFFLRMIGVRLEISKLITIFPEIRFHLDNFHLMALKEFLKTPEAASAYIIAFGTEWFRSRFART